MDKNKKDMDIFLDAINNLPDDILRAKYNGYNPKKTKSSQITPKSPFDDTIDLHGLTRREALLNLRNTLTYAKGRRLRILVITGKGNHSEDGYGVIREAVCNFLEKEGKVYIREYGFAPRKNGGEGAIEIFTK